MLIIKRGYGDYKSWLSRFTSNIACAISKLSLHKMVPRKSDVVSCPLLTTYIYINHLFSGGWLCLFPGICSKRSATIDRRRLCHVTQWWSHIWQRLETYGVRKNLWFWLELTSYLIPNSSLSSFNGDGNKLSYYISLPSNITLSSDSNEVEKVAQQIKDNCEQMAPVRGEYTHTGCGKFRYIARLESLMKNLALVDKVADKSVRNSTVYSFENHSTKLLLW